MLYYHLQVLVCLACAADAAKQRPWLDSTVSLLEGVLPLPRDSHGFASTEDGKIYLFGGLGTEGDVDAGPSLPKTF